MKRVWILTSTIIIASLIFFFVQKPNDPINFPSSGENIIIFGDSLAYGIGANPGFSIASQLSDYTKLTVINAGVPGDNTSDALKRLNNLPPNPYLTIVIIGGNDVIQGRKSEETYSNVREIVRHLQEKGSIVALASVRSSVLTEGELTENYKKIAEETGSIFIGNILEDIFGKPELMSDQIHPNSDGYTLITDRIYKSIKDYLPR